VLRMSHLLKLPTVARKCDTMARQALSDGQHPLGFLRRLLEAEMASSAERAAERRLRAARLPARKTLSPPTSPSAIGTQLVRGHFVEPSRGPLAIDLFGWECPAQPAPRATS
jgi:hypothetical protein